MIRRFAQIRAEGVLLYAFVALSLGASIITLVYGLDFSDSFYHINKINGDYLQDPLMFFAYWLARGWAICFGNTLLSFRLLHFVCYLLSCLSIIGLLHARIERKTLLLYFGLSLLMFACTSYNVVGTDSVASLLTIVVICLVLRYVYGDARVNLFISGVVSSLLVASRLPSAGLIPIVCFVCILRPWAHPGADSRPYRQAILDLGIYLGSFALSMFLVVLCFYGTPAAYFAGIVHSLHSAGDTHGLSGLAKAYVLDGRAVVQYACVLFTIGFLAVNPKPAKPTRWAMVALITLVFMLVSVRLGYPYNKTLSLFITACFLLLMARAFYSKAFYTERLALLFLALAPFVAGLGSNTGLLKMVFIWLPMLPLVHLYTKDEDPGIRRYSHAILTLVVIFSVANKPLSFYEDSAGLFAKSAAIRSGRLKGIRTTETRIRYLDDVSQDLAGLRAAGHPLLLYGYMAHVFYYMLELKPLYEQSFSMKMDDRAELEDIRLQIAKISPAIVIVDHYPGLATNKTDNGLSPIDEMIRAQHYTLYQGHDYRIWLPPGAAPGGLNAVNRE